MAPYELDSAVVARNRRWAYLMWALIAVSFVSAYFARHILYHTVFQ